MQANPKSDGADVIRIDALVCAICVTLALMPHRDFFAAVDKMFEAIWWGLAVYNALKVYWYAHAGRNR